VQTDFLFFRIFQTAPGILFELLGGPFEQGQNYEFRSMEVKQTSFQLDGIFGAQAKLPEQTVIFVEVQFQKDKYLYDRMFAEIDMYLMQNRPTADWRVIAIFPRKSLEPKDNH
jgi:predicted transposase/invertase (TIGR01784 family)